MIAKEKMVARPKLPHFPSIGSDDPPPLPPLGVENVKIRENSEQIRGPPGLFNPF